MIQGLNITVDIQRRTAGVDDDIGGAVTTTATVFFNVRARISNLKPSDEQRIQGIEVTKMFTCHIWPATIDIQEHDLVVPNKGPHKDKVFLVKGVRKDSLFDENPRSHISVSLERTEQARSLQ